MSRSAFAAAISIAVAALLPASSAQAQWYSSVSQPPPPLYPYAVPSDRPYAVEVSPGMYVIQRPAASRPHPYVRTRHADKPASAPRAPASDRPHVQVDRALVDELRKRSKIKHTSVNTTKIVRDPPVVIETKRYVDDPPRIIERYHVEGEKPVTRPGKRVAVVEPDIQRDTTKHKRTHKSAGKSRGEEKRVIEADAEITILGADRMNIRLFRKGGAKANAQAD